MRRIGCTAILPTAILLWLSGPSSIAAQEPAAWPQRVLITNDDGIHEERLWPLARAFAERSETWVVAATEDRSGSSNFTALGKHQRSLFVRRVHRSENLTAFAVAGYPADCVVFGIRGLLKSNPPDLVVSGINGGPNLGTDGWFGSGTLGAARTAAFLGIPAIAVSGLDDDDPQMVAAVTRWVVELASRPIVRELEPGQYLTVAVPRVAAGEIRGVRLAPRMPSIARFELDRVLFEEDDGETEEVWVLRSLDREPGVPPGDGPPYLEGYIVVTPMRLGEDDREAISDLRGRTDALPQWREAP